MHATRQHARRHGQASIDSSSSSSELAPEDRIISPSSSAAITASGGGGAASSGSPASPSTSTASRLPVSANYVPRRYGHHQATVRAVSSTTTTTAAQAAPPVVVGGGLRSVSAPLHQAAPESGSKQRPPPISTSPNPSAAAANAPSSPSWTAAGRSPKDRIAFARKRSQSQSSVRSDGGENSAGGGAAGAWNQTRDPLPALPTTTAAPVPSSPSHTQAWLQERAEARAREAAAAAGAVSPALAQERRERAQRSLGRLPLGGTAVGGGIGLGLSAYGTNASSRDVNAASRSVATAASSLPSSSSPTSSNGVPLPQSRANEPTVDEEVLQSPAINDFNAHADATASHPPDVAQPRPSYEGYDHILERYERPFSALPAGDATFGQQQPSAAERAVHALEPEVSIPSSDSYVYAPTPSAHHHTMPPPAAVGDVGVMARRAYAGPSTPDVSIEMTESANRARRPPHLSGDDRESDGDDDDDKEDLNDGDDDIDELESRGGGGKRGNGRLIRLSQSLGRLPYLSSNLPSRFSRSSFNKGAAAAGGETNAADIATAGRGPGFSDSPLWSKQHEPGAGLSEKTEQFAADAAAKADARKREKAARAERRRIREARQRKRRWWICGGLALLVVIAVAIAVPVAIVTGRNKKSNGSTSGSTSGSGGSTTGGGTSINATTAYTSPTSPVNPLALPLFGTSYYASKSGIAITNGSVITGHDGSTLYHYLNGTLETFTYSNQWGGYWQYDPNNPLEGGGKAQSWTPAIDEEWVWGRDTIKGVNLGGWLVIEPFIVPSLFEANEGAVDEWTLSEMLAAKGPGVLESTLRYHYETFITEQDFAEIAGAGLNYVRIPLGFWAVETLDSEPFLEGVAWQYFVRALGWARKYGLRVLLDLHGLPGSQNGWNHSGKAGVVNWMYGVMGIANAQRTLDVLRSLAEFISQPEYENVVTILSLVNEVQSQVVGVNALQTFYYQAYQTIREASGVGKGPIVLGHEGFVGIAEWANYLPGADRFAIDQHPYLAFLTPQNANTMEQNWKQVCGWGGGTNDSSTNFGITIAGEWSVAISDCGLWLDGVGSVPVYNQTVGSCVPLDDWRTWTPEYKSNISTLALASMDSLQNWIFWTWKIGNSTQLGYPSSPGWHYRLGLQQGWIPADPRKAAGVCASVGVGGNQFSGTYPASATGGGNGQIATASIGSYSAWPPASLGPSPSYGSAQIALMPTYTQTGTPVTLTHAAVPTAAAVQPGGWANTGDTAKAWTAVAGCTYPDAWNATASSLLPTAVCTGSGQNKRSSAPIITARPERR